MGCAPVPMRRDNLAMARAKSPSSKDSSVGSENADTFRRDHHPDLRADYVLANPPFNDCDTALRGSAFLQPGGKPQVITERHDNFRKDDDVRWQPSGARQIAKGNPQGERGGVHQFGVPPRGNANFAWVQHLIHHLAASANTDLAQTSN